MKRIIIIIIILLTTGCWDEREIRDLGIINSFLFDYKDEKIIFMAEIVNPKTQSLINPAPSGSTPYIYIKGEGKSLLDASNNSVLTFNKYIYSAHTNAIFLTENFAREKGLVPILDFFSRYPELRQDEYMVIVKGEDADTLYKSTSSLADFFGDFVFDSQKNQSYRLSKSIYTTMLDVVKKYYCDMEEPILGVIQKMPVDNNEEDKDDPVTQDIVKDDTKALYEGAAIFEKDKLKYLITGEETLIYNLIIGKSRAINIDVGKVTYKILDDKPKIKMEYKNNKVKIDILLSLEMMAVLDEGNDDFNNIKTISKLEKKINEKLSKDIKKFLDKAQTTIGVDFLSFANTFHIKYPKEWKKIKLKWKEYFKKADINVKVNSAIISEGKIHKSVRVED